jgi:hypothetical protein
MVIFCLQNGTLIRTASTRFATPQSQCLFRGIDLQESMEGGWDLAAIDSSHNIPTDALQVLFRSQVTLSCRTRIRADM